MIFVNLTPHAVTIRFAGEIDETFPPSGDVARVVTDIDHLKDIDGCPVVRTVYLGTEGLPKPADETVYIVSVLVLTSLDGARDDVVAPDTGPESAIRDGAGRIIAVRRFTR